MGVAFIIVLQKSAHPLHLVHINLLEQRNRTLIHCLIVLCIRSAISAELSLRGWG